MHNVCMWNNELWTNDAMVISVRSEHLVHPPVSCYRETKTLLMVSLFLIYTISWDVQHATLFGCSHTSSHLLYVDI